SGVKSGRLLEALAQYETDCRRLVRLVRVDTYVGYSAGSVKGGEQSLDLDRSPGDAALQLAGAAASCKKVMGSLDKLNADVALPNGFLFSFDVDNFISRRATARDIGGWIAYLSAKPARLEQLRKVILESAPAGKYKKYRSCVADASKTQAECNKFLIHVNLTTYSGFESFRALEWLTIFIAPGIGTVLGAFSDAAIDGPGVSLDATQSPWIPTKIQD
ncbi:MAG: hypothetical protein HY075_07070, partial [Deltaproteobacteria bacterium]|nr:hypothetical protein [Deltaproteobacteria bacterium]